MLEVLGRSGHLDMQALEGGSGWDHTHTLRTRELNQLIISLWQNYISAHSVAHGPGYFQQFQLLRVEGL